MNPVTKIASAFAAGAAAMYFMDPLVGRRRRALVRDKGVAAGHDIEDFARSKGRRAADKLNGVVAETKAALAAAPVGDAQLRERIRSRLGRIVESPETSRWTSPTGTWCCEALPTMTRSPTCSTRCR